MPKRPVQAAWINVGGRDVLLSDGPDDNYADDHQYVRLFPQMFRDIVIIEQATAAPGERRASVRR